MTKRLDIDPLVSGGDLADRLSVKRGIVEQYFGLWAYEPQRFRSAVHKLEGIDLTSHVASNRANYDALGRDAFAEIEFSDKQDMLAAVGDRRLYNVAGNGVAIIEVRGPILKYVSSFDDGTSSVFVRRQIHQALSDPEIGAILIVGDSPGGTVAGTMDLASTISRANEKKPVHYFAEDLTASAAYWLASQCRKISANNATALVGSIGTYAVLYDLSQAAEDLGIKVHVVSTGRFKGAGVEGTEITPEQISEVQRIVDALNSEFLDAVSAGRDMTRSAVEQLADGRVHPAGDAKSLGLIDTIQGMQESIDELSTISDPITRSTAVMTQPETTQASIAELRAAIPNADSDFLIQQMDNEATVEEATRAWNAHLEEENKQLKAAAEEREKEATEKAAADAAIRGGGTKGTKPVQTGTPANETQSDHELDDPEAEFDRRVRQRMSATNCTRIVASRKEARRDPVLHQSYLRATNSNATSQRLISEKYDE